MTGTEKHVLLVEDNEINAEIARIQLEDMEYVVDWVSNGARAVEMFGDSEIDYYELIVMDLMMPVMDGVEAARIIRHLGRLDAETVPIIAISANAFPEDRENSVQNGVTRFITKPYSKKTLQDAIKELTEPEVEAAL